MSDEPFDAYMKKYARVFDPEANAIATLAKQEAAERRARMARMWAAAKTAQERCP